MEHKTNKHLANEIGCTSRQISKSRKRGWIWKDGKKIKYKAPLPVFLPGMSKYVKKKKKDEK